MLQQCTTAAQLTVTGYSSTATAAMRQQHRTAVARYSSTRQQHHALAAQLAGAGYSSTTLQQQATTQRYSSTATAPQLAARNNSKLQQHRWQHYAASPAQRPQPNVHDQDSTRTGCSGGMEGSVFIKTIITSECVLFNKNHNNI